MTVYQDCSGRHDLSKNMVASGWDLFFLYIYIEKFKNLLVRNHKTDFSMTLQKYSFGNPIPRLFKPLWFVKKPWPLGAELIFPLYRKILKSSSQKPLNKFQYNLAEGFPCRGQGLFSLYIYIENLLVRNHWTDFNITWQECSFGDPLPSLFKLSWFVKKHGR